MKRKSKDNKALPQHPNKNLKKPADSIVKACFPFQDLMGGEIKHVSFDCPENLRNAFKTAVKANGSSVCPVLQTFMVTYLAANHYQKACFSDTIRSPVIIEKLVVPTYIKKRIRRFKKETVEVEEEVTVCGFRGCEEVAVAAGVYRKDREFLLCEKHLVEAKSKPREWKVLRMHADGI